MAEFTVQSARGTTTFESNHPNQLALYERLNTLVGNGSISSSFAKDLASGYRQYGNWREKQEAWAALMVAQHDHPERFRSGEAETTQLGSVVEHLRGSSLKRPCVILVFGQNQSVALKVCGPQSRKAGCISVSESPKFGEGAFYGYIEQDGAFAPRAGTPDEVVEVLERVAVDPPRVISEIGRQSGLCCYCNAPLTQVQSKIAGCGAKCAKNYGVEYPNAARTREILAENAEWLVGATDAERWV